MIEIFENLDADQQIALISAGAALLGAIIGPLATLAATWLNKKVQSSGKVLLYAKIVHSKGNTNRSWGYYRSENKSESSPQHASNSNSPVQYAD